jgi:preprotein translocase subunit SecY
MKKLIDTFKNIFAIEELRTRIIFTVVMLLIYRLASFIVLPGINPIELEAIQPEGGSKGLEGIINLFAGGAFSRASVIALGIMPYISASIVVQLLGLVYPPIQKLQKEGESGRNKINQMTRFLTIAITAAQAFAFVINLKSQYLSAIVLRTGDEIHFSFWLSTIFVLTAGTMFVMWIGEKITDKGIGNGISLIIAMGIIARLPGSIVKELQYRTGENGGGLVPFVIEIAVWLAIIAVTILLVQAVRKIALQVAGRVVSGKTEARNFLPLKLNASGVMPIIFAQAIMFLPMTIAQFFPDRDWAQAIMGAMSDFRSVWYNVILVLLIVSFTYLYTSLSVNANQIAEDLKRGGSFVPGIKPGEETANHIDDILSKITLPGSLMLALIAILPSMAVIFGVNDQFAQFFGGTSLLIMVGVVLDTLQQIETYLLSKEYDGLMESGRVQGRTQNAVGAQI